MTPAAPSEPLVLRQDRDGVATLTLNRPAQRNALSVALMGALQAELDRPDLTQHDQVHDEIGEPHEGGPGDRAARPDEVAPKRHPGHAASILERLDAQTEKGRERQAVAHDALDIGDRHVAWSRGARARSWVHA